jgi:hypothetical protein
VDEGASTFGHDDGPKEQCKPGGSDQGSLEHEEISEFLDREHADICLNSPIEHDSEDASRCNIRLEREVIPYLEFGPDGRDHILKESSGLNDRDSGPHESDCAPEENHGYASPHSKRASHNDGEWDMIGGSDATSETDDETAKKESSKRDGNDFASGESE